MDRRKQRWFSGRILACHAGGPGSIPGRCKLLLFFKSILNRFWVTVNFIQQKIDTFECEKWFLSEFTPNHKYQHVCHCTFFYLLVISAGSEVLRLDRICFTFWLKRLYEVLESCRRYAAVKSLIHAWIWAFQWCHRFPHFNFFLGWCRISQYTVFHVFKHSCSHRSRCPI